MKPEEQRRIVEALVLASQEPISAVQLANIVPDCTAAAAKDLVNQLNTEYQEQDRAFEIWEVAGGYQIRTRAEFSGYLQRLQKQRPLRLSRAALETLSIVAYKQPATRAEVEYVRGVESGAVLKTLLDRQLVKIEGHREVPGRPMLYGTSKRFLELFGLKSVKDLPNLRELEELARESGIGVLAAEGEESEVVVELDDEGELAEDGDGDAEAGEEEGVGDDQAFPRACEDTN
jgi:segregation and condensation protein B